MNENNACAVGWCVALIENTKDTCCKVHQQHPNYKPKRLSISHYTLEHLRNNNG